MRRVACLDPSDLACLTSCTWKWHDASHTLIRMSPRSMAQTRMYMFIAGSSREGCWGLAFSGLNTTRVNPCLSPVGRKGKILTPICRLHSNIDSSQASFSELHQYLNIYRHTYAYQGHTPVSIPRGFLPKGISPFRLADPIDDPERRGVVCRSVA